MKTQLAFAGAIRPVLVGAIAISTVALSPEISRADEGVFRSGSGLFGSLAAPP